MNSGTNLFAALVAIIVVSCATPRDSSGKKCYRKTKLVLSATWSGKVNDTWFELREGNYFRYYQKLAGALKMAEYAGSYKSVNDSLQLHFCGDELPANLNGWALLDTAKREVILFGTEMDLDQTFHYKMVMQ